jgi:Chorismate synthase
MPIIRTSKNMVSKRAVVVVGAALVKQLVRYSSSHMTSIFLTTRSLGRVAAGAIAEKYLRQAHGIEIVAFVSSVGKVHLPSFVPNAVDDKDEAEDVLSSQFRALLATVTREEVDKFPTRCPHPETSEHMTKVCNDRFPNYLSSLSTYPDRLAYHSR